MPRSLKVYVTEYRGERLYGAYTAWNGLAKDMGVARNTARRHGLKLKPTKEEKKIALSNPNRMFKSHDDIPQKGKPSKSGDYYIYDVEVKTKRKKKVITQNGRLYNPNNFSVCHECNLVLPKNVVTCWNCGACQEPRLCELAEAE